MRWLAIVAIVSILGGCHLLLPGENDTSDAAGPDAARPDAPPGFVCYGAAGIGGGGVCIQPPTAPLPLPGAISTDPNPQCQSATGADDYCVIAGTEVTLMQPLAVSGARPLVVIATGTLVIDDTFDLAAHIGGTVPAPGGESARCNPGIPPAQPVQGGAGGSFGTLGGKGEQQGDNNTALPGATTPPTPQVDRLRGGCRGQHAVGTTNGGFGGGAIYLIAGVKIQISTTGAINASGAPGRGGPSGTGGGGGGAGGLIGLDAPTIAIDGRVFADGGGAGGGGYNGITGQDGSEPDGSTYAAGGAGAVAGPAGTGGAGAWDNSDGWPANPKGTQVGGGGGGGDGVIWTHGTVVRGSSGMISPPPIGI